MKKEKAVIWVVGDSTLSPFDDQSYYPREAIMHRQFESCVLIQKPNVSI